jgi:hypothetical protein
MSAATSGAEEFFRRPRAIHDRVAQLTRRIPPKFRPAAESRTCEGISGARKLLRRRPPTTNA